MRGNVSFGTWKLPLGSAEGLTALALSVGFRSIDTAAAYANERNVGKAIVAAETERKHLFVSGKLWITRRTHDSAIKACKKSLKNLGIGYFDQYLIHWPASPDLHKDAESLNVETWGALEEMISEGLVRSIGVCNYSIEELERLLNHASVLPSVNQIEMHPGHYPKELIDFCAQSRISVEAWSPLGHGAVLKHPTIVRIAEIHGCAPAQICLKWCCERGVMPIVGASSERHMREALSADDLELTEYDLIQIDEMESCGFSGMRSEADVA